MLLTSLLSIIRRDLNVCYKILSRPSQIYSNHLSKKFHIIIFVSHILEIFILFIFKVNELFSIKVS